ncbi:MAG: ferrous iron transporter B [Clostridiales bacterium]|nr:ferrous iron transporter B [Clostridiales bacterium]
MGLTRAREGNGRSLDRERADCPVIALIGSPNVGKSTVFNALTGLNRHTGNWTGKTVDRAVGIMREGGERFALVDLPGCYSLVPTSPEEELTRDFVMSGEADCVVIVCDASCMERSLNMVLQTLAVTGNAVVCVNLTDEAAKKGVRVDTVRLSEILGVEAVPTSAANKKGLGELAKAIKRAAKGKKRFEKAEPRPMWREAERIAEEVTERDKDTVGAKQMKLDRFLTGRYTSLIVMLLLLALVFFLTMEGANLPSRLLGSAFEGALLRVRTALLNSALPEKLVLAFCDGGLATLMTVVSVMLPPMAIFFPLFTLLEDLGLLPRIAFNLDRSFCKCGSCGKQALTMCMGFGCNAAGVVGCRIIESPRERTVAILTNSLIPCNGRFPTLAALLAVLFAGAGGGALRALGLTGLILLSLAMTLLVSKLLSMTLLSGKPSSFILELPPFRKPRIGQIIIRSALDRTLFVLGRACAVAFPAGIVIWVLANCGNTPPIMGIAAFLDPAGRLMGVDGAVLLAFLLGLPANELVLPLLIMIYSGGGTLTGVGSAAVGAALFANGWSAKTAVCMLLLVLFHSPCATTLLSIRRETKSRVWTLAAALIPVLLGVVLCSAVNGIWTLLS